MSTEAGKKAAAYTAVDNHVKVSKIWLGLPSLLIYFYLINTRPAVKVL